MARSNYRLPLTLRPINYALYIIPHYDGNFRGIADIDIAVIDATNKIVLHSHTLDIGEIDVTDPYEHKIEVESFELDTLLQFLNIKLARELQPQEIIRVHLIYQGRMNGKLVGLYSSSYFNAEGERRLIATTKFEPTYARQAFPCFDEPGMKATFGITLVHPSADGYHALSNMNIVDTVDYDDLCETTFEESVPMSTYLAAFIVSDFVPSTKTVNANGIGKNFNIRIFAAAHQLTKVNFALDTAVAIAEFYIQYFKVEYPLPKLDMISIPDFASGAMENWGLITFREALLLYDKSYSSTWNKQRVASVIAHELSHMWFGNLVTLQWWNDLWLNEGFARYMEYKGVNEVHPDWGMPDQFLIHALHNVMQFDSSVASHPIIKTVDNPDQISEVFDTISYDKGASIIRMLEDFVGPDIFKQAVMSYLSNFKFQNARTDDFIGEIAKLGLDIDVKLIMRTWTEQKGLPVVNVERVSDTEYRLTQKRFLANVEDYDVVYDDSVFDYTWYIPITYRTNESACSKIVWFDHQVNCIYIDVPSTTKWIKINTEQVGYYRVNYEEKIWKEIVANLVSKPEILSIADRAHLLNDVFALADATQLSYDIALDMTTYLVKEFDFVPWHVATTKLEALKTILMNTDIYSHYLGYARSIICKVYNEVGWNIDGDSNHLKNRLRVSILTTACSLGLPDCLTEVVTRFNLWLEDPEKKPHPDLREIIYYYGIATVGTDDAWKQVWSLYTAEQDANEKLKLMYGLSAVKNPAILSRFVDLAADENYVRRQDYITCLQNIAANPIGNPIVCFFVNEKWMTLVERFGLNDRVLGRLIPSITGRFATKKRLTEMQEFFRKYPEAGAGSIARQQALETVKYNIKWLELNKAKVGNWLKNHKSWACLNYRLPPTLRPTHYALYILPRYDGHFGGVADIDVLVEKATNRIVLHSHSLEIKTVAVTDADMQKIQVVSFEHDTLLQFLYIHLARVLTPGETIKVDIAYQGRMDEKLVGLYSSSYLTEKGDRRTIATTTFEPTNARQAFPCFDEPAMKATFKITLAHPSEGGYHGLSNMNAVQTLDFDGFSETTFSKTVPMSTYLTAFIVSDFSHSTKTVDTKGIGKKFNIRIFATAQQITKVDFAHETAVAVTEFYIQYFKVEYPLPKLDMIAIPDFVSNAMENWGLITYREAALLYDKSYSSTFNKQRVAVYVAHEVSHMWFGNLVSLKWWSDLWLKEGFAVYMEYKSLNEVYPDWGVPDQFLIHALHSVMQFDSWVASHPIIQSVTNPDQITEVFDAINYEKGASILRMLEDFVGSEKLREGITNYLNKYKFANAASDDFIDEIAKTGLKFDVKLIMRTWTEQKGLPVVNVERVSKTQYRLTQKRFFANIQEYDEVYDDSVFNYTWYIPITYRINGNPDSQTVWFDYRVKSINIAVPSSTKWIKINTRQVGYYRVNYQEANWKQLIEHLKIRPEIFSIADRAHLLNDAFALADAAQLSYDIALDMTTYLVKEFDFVPWYVATTKLEALKYTLMCTDAYSDFLEYARSLLRKAYNEVGWNADDDKNLLKNRLRVSILTAACSLGLPECLTEVANRFNAWLANPANKPHPDLREIIYYYGMESVGTAVAWEKVWALFIEEQDANEKLKLMYGLSGIRIPVLLSRLVGLAANEQYIRSQDYFTCLINIAANPAGTSVVWDYVRDHWLALVKRFGLNQRYMGRMIPTITGRFATKTRLDEMQEFFRKNPEAGAGAAARQQALETVKYNIKWLELNKVKVANWLENYALELLCK